MQEQQNGWQLETFKMPIIPLQYNETLRFISQNQEKKIQSDLVPACIYST